MQVRAFPAHSEVKMKNHVKNFMLTVLCPTVTLVVLVLLCLNPSGCRSTVEGVDLIDGDYSVPKIKSFCVASSNCVAIDFSRNVTVSDVCVFRKDGGGLNSQVCFAEYENDSKTAMLRFPDSTVTGETYVAEGTVRDENGNTLTFSIPFLGYNENMARVILSEVRNCYGIASVNKVKVHKGEYVELYVLEDGNLSGIEICSASDGSKTRYIIPPCEVKKGDYVTVHMRKGNTKKVVEDGMISELGSNLLLSSHVDSSSSRDLWSENLDSVFPDNDVVYARNSQNGKIIDAVVFGKSSLKTWNTACERILQKLWDSGIWQGGFEADRIVCADYVTSTAASRSYSRINVGQIQSDYDRGMFLSGEPFPNSRENWIVTDKATPGTANSNSIYTK